MGGYGSIGGSGGSGGDGIDITGELLNITNTGQISGGQEDNLDLDNSRPIRSSAMAVLALELTVTTTTLRIPALFRVARPLRDICSAP